MQFKTSLLATAVLLLPAAAMAQPVTGLYIAAGAGVNWLMESDLTADGTLAAQVGAAGFTRGGQASFDVGWVGVASLGWGFGNGVRVEVEGNYRANDVDSVSGFGAARGPNAFGGSVQSYGAMLNAFYDFDMGANFTGISMVPYVGVGAGYIVNNWDNVRARSGTTGNQLVIDGDNGNFAYQLIAGVATSLNQYVPGLALTLEYRFMQTLSDDVDARLRTPAGASIGRAGAVEVESLNHSVLVGLRYAFNQPAPPPVVAPVAPAAAPAPARTYLVFFDFDRADLTERARQIIADAATNAGRVQVTRIEVAGHADRAGTPQYNQRLSERRAQAVAAELERRGIPRSAITVQAFGESRPLVPTADGVREPQNRRVEIVLR
jgi:outer membrane protein OmpA-like peptidoglycan-associated protein